MLSMVSIQLAHRTVHPNPSVTAQCDLQHQKSGRAAPLRLTAMGQKPSAQADAHFRGITDDGWGGVSHGSAAHGQE
jgi:hypothetical protein